MFLSWIKRAIGVIISLYSKHFPLEKGKGRLRTLFLRIMDGQAVVAYARDGSMFSLSFPQDRGRESIYLRGTHEPGTTRVLRKILEEDDIVFDVGANIGWYTVFAAKIVTRGQCHAFEPVPFIFEELQRNCLINELGNNLILNQVAVGEKENTVELHTFAGLPYGHSSLSTLGRDDYSTFRVRMTTIDKYLKTNAIKRLDLVKLDVEGAEMSVLRGAKSIFDYPSPPIWIIEMNKETAENFGYSPADLLRFLEEHGTYRFYRLADSLGTVIRMSSLEEYDNGDNVLCIPFSRGDELDILDQLSNNG